MISSYRSAGLGACLVAMTVLLQLATPASALGRSDGNYWTYELTTSIEDIDVTGTITYEFVEESTLVVGSESYEVSIMSVTGSMSGSGDILGITVDVTGAYSGHVYEARDSLGIIKEDMSIWANLSKGTGQYVQTDSWQFHDVTEYSPPLGSELIPGEMATGDSWDETVDESSNSTQWVNGVIAHQSNETIEDVTYSYSIAAATEAIETEAGTFDCLRINVSSDDSDDYEVYWYDDDVGYFVKISIYENGETSPSMSLELESYDNKSDESEMLMLIVGIGILVIVVIVIIALLAMRKRGRSPASVSSQAPLATPPRQPPTQ